MVCGTVQLGGMWHGGVRCGMAALLTCAALAPRPPGTLSSPNSNLWRRGPRWSAACGSPSNGAEGYLRAVDPLKEWWQRSVIMVGLASTTCPWGASPHFGRI
ncbi:hypothetical protein ACP4OV_002091 [Aristida adscensionis]